ncbi:unnamed protein product [Boreogadus saida]
MTDVEATFERFIASRRSGRRNAVLPVYVPANLVGDTSTSASAMELSHDLAQLSIDKSGDEGEDPENSPNPTAEEEGEEEVVKGN